MPNRSDLLLLFLSAQSLAQVTFFTQPQDATVAEGGDATFQCAAEENGMALLFIWDFTPVGGSRMSVGTGTTVPGISMVTVSSDRTQLTLSGVQREVDGATVLCVALGTTKDVDSNPATISVQRPPVYTFLPNQTTSVLGRENFTYSFGFEANPTPTNFTWSRDGQVLSSGGRIATSVNTISITSTTRSDSGVYEVVSYNEAGRGAGNFTLDVQFPPLIINRASQTALAQGEVFTFDCTSEPANPAAVDYTFQKDGQTVDGSRATVQGPVLTIASVQAGDGGNYSCSANNSVGRDTVYHSLIVPPGVPQALNVSDLGPFSATVSWQPPLEDGGAVGSLMYTVMLTNTSDSATFKFNPTAALTMNLANLRHSVTYRVQVVAGNEAGMGPAAEVMFRTNDTVPTVSGVEAIALTLDTVQVDVTVSDDGGQPVLEYTVTVSGTTVMFSKSRGNVTGLSLMNGVIYNISVVARNSIGASQTFTGSFSVPLPPNITMQPVAVTPDETTTRCCAGVRVFLEDPSDPTLVFTAQVSTDNTSFTARNVTRNNETKDVVYVQELQAGTPYNIRLTAWNQFGSVTKKVFTTPLIGYPSNPSMPVVSVEGSSVSIQLSTRYPGTNARGQFRFSLMFSAASTAKRQSLQPTEVRVDPTGLDSSVTTTHTLTDVAAGSYSVSVMAVNEYGTSQDVTAPFVVEAPPTDLAPVVDNGVVIGVVVAVVIVILLLLILAVFVIVLVCMKRRDAKAMYKPKSEGSGDADYKEMVDTNSTDPLAPHYEDPSTLERQAPPPVVTYKKEEEAAMVQPAPAASGVIYADLDFSRQQALGSKKPENKKPEPIETVVYSEVRLMTPQEKQQRQERGEGEVGGDGEEPHSPTTIM